MMSPIEDFYQKVVDFLRASKKRCPSTRCISLAIEIEEMRTVNKDKISLVVDVVTLRDWRDACQSSRQEAERIGQVIEEARMRDTAAG
jgi:hypothetical protein